MKRIVFGIVLLASLGAAAYLYLRPGAQPATQDQAARQAFLEERGGPALNAQMPVMGSIEQIDGTTLTVKNPMDGLVTTVELGEETPILSQVDGTRADLMPGAGVTVVGAERQGVFEAALVQLGGGLPGMMTFGPGDGPPTGGVPPQNAVTIPFTGQLPAEGAPGGSGQNVLGEPAHGGAALAAPLAGTVERLEGDILTLKKADGALVEVRLVRTTSIRKQQQLERSALAQGTSVLVSGSREGERFKATSVELMPAGGMVVRPD